MTPVQTIKAVIAQGSDPERGLSLTKLQVPAEVMKMLRKELKLKATEPVVIDDVPIECLDERSELIMRGTAYAFARWGQEISEPEMNLIFKAIDTKELPSLMQLVIDQHMDSAGVEDPAAQMEAAEHKAFCEEIREMGFDDSAI